MSRPSAGLIWMVASRAIYVCHVAAVSRTSVTAPSVRQERKVMMAITSTIARPATLSGGTMGVCLRASLLFACRFTPASILSLRRASLLLAIAPLQALVIDFQPPAGKHHAPRLHLVH